MVAKLTKTGLVDAVAKQAGLDKKSAQKAVDAFISAMKTSLRKGQNVDIRGFGNFNLKHRDARVGRNPQTGAAIKTPAHTVLTFKVGKEMKESVWDVKVK